MAINFNKAEFVLSAVKASTFIRDGKPQVTFAGRSNVGKSSVINRLLGRKNFARVGATPGKTNQINYFDIDGKIYFTDLPGYGYAKVSKEERDRWGRLMESYFAEPDLITLGVLIVDARHKPTADDVTMCDWFKGTGCPVIVVANKLDKLKKSEIRIWRASARRCRWTRARRSSRFPRRRGSARRSCWRRSETAAVSEYENPSGLPQTGRWGFADYWSSCSSTSNSGVEKNSPRVMSRPSQSILMVSSLGFWLLP